MASIKIQRLQELIRKKAATVIQRDLNDPRVQLVTVTRVELTKDLSECKVYWSTLLEDGARRTIASGLEDARGFIQREVAGILKTRRTPHVELVFDEAIEGMERVSRLIDEARAEDRERQEQRGETEDEAREDEPGADPEGELR